MSSRLDGKRQKHRLRPVAFGNGESHGIDHHEWCRRLRQMQEAANLAIVIAVVIGRCGQLSKIRLQPSRRRFRCERVVVQSAYADIRRQVQKQCGNRQEL
jgi:hypothetical protein